MKTLLFYISLLITILILPSVAHAQDYKLILYSFYDTNHDGIQQTQLLESSASDAIAIAYSVEQGFSKVVSGLNGTFIFNNLKCSSFPCSYKVGINYERSLNRGYGFHFVYFLEVIPSVNPKVLTIPIWPVLHREGEKIAIPAISSDINTTYSAASNLTSLKIQLFYDHNGDGEFTIGDDSAVEKGSPVVARNTNGLEVHKTLGDHGLVEFLNVQCGSTFCAQRISVNYKDRYHWTYTDFQLVPNNDVDYTIIPLHPVEPVGSRINIPVIE